MQITMVILKCEILLISLDREYEVIVSRSLVSGKLKCHAWEFSATLKLCILVVQGRRNKIKGKTQSTRDILIYKRSDMVELFNAGN